MKLKIAALMMLATSVCFAGPKEKSVDVPELGTISEEKQKIIDQWKIRRGVGEYPDRENVEGEYYNHKDKYKGRIDEDGTWYNSQDKPTSRNKNKCKRLDRSDDECPKRQKKEKKERKGKKTK